MAWTEPVDANWNLNDIPTEGIVKEQVLDNLRYLKGEAGKYAMTERVMNWTSIVDNEVGKGYIGPAPSFLAGYTLTKISVCHGICGDTRKTEIAVKLIRHNSTSTYSVDDICTTPPTIDISELSSLDAAVAAVFDAAHITVAEGDIWRIDTIAHQAGAYGLSVTLEFEKA